MGNNEFIKWTKFLDDNGAFSVADELENDFVKIAQPVRKYVFPLPGSSTDYYSELRQTSQLNSLRIPTINGEYPDPRPAYEYSSKTGQKAPPGVEFSPKGIPQPLGTGDQWYAQKLFESMAPYSQELGPEGIEANEYWKRMNPGKELKFDQEYSPRGFLQRKGWGEAYAASKVFESFPYWNPKNISPEAKKFLIKKGLLEKPKKPTIDSQTTTATPSKPASESPVKREPQPSRKPPAPKKPTAPLMVDWSESGVQVPNTKPTTDPTIDFE